MTIKQQITKDPNKAFNNFVQTEEQNEIFNKLRDHNLRNVKILTTEFLTVATKYALLTMLENNQI